MDHKLWSEHTESDDDDDVYLDKNNKRGVLKEMHILSQCET
jgi:hypothetical protein